MPPTTLRKLLVTGDYTYTLTLPKAWVQQLRWRKRQQLLLELRGERIVVRDAPTPPARRPACRPPP